MDSLVRGRSIELGQRVDELARREADAAERGLRPGVLMVTADGATRRRFRDQRRSRELGLAEMDTEHVARTSTDCAWS